MAEIIIKIPDDLIDLKIRSLFLMAGVETIGYKHPGNPWMIKTGKCSNCGKCCEGWKDTDEFPPSHNGKCDYLIPDGAKKVCSLGANRPFACSIAINHKEGCTQSFESAGV